GPYEIVAFLGAGGMGEVYKARDIRLNRTVAVKISQERFSERFAREAQIIATLNHPHICMLHDVGPDYLVMEYVDGEPVRGPLPPEEAVRVGLQIVAALEEAHSKHILHRDLKPANILLTKSASGRPGAAKLLDFGLAKVMSDPDATQTMTISGTPLYMSPEQAEGKLLDERSGIFSFGLVLYEMLSGRRAFESLAGLLRDNPAELSLPGGHIAMRCLAKKPQ